MSSAALLVLGAIVFLLPGPIECQYEDVRCKCVCPVPTVVVNDSRTTNRKLYIGNVMPNECNCDYVVLPQLEPNIQNKAKEFCPLCECKYESRNTSVIRFFVICILGLVSFLTVYMFFLMILEPWMYKSLFHISCLPFSDNNNNRFFVCAGNVRASYSEHVNEEVNLEEQGADGEQRKAVAEQYVDNVFGCCCGLSNFSFSSPGPKRHRKVSSIVSRTLNPNGSFKCNNNAETFTTITLSSIESSPSQYSIFSCSVSIKFTFYCFDSKSWRFNFVNLLNEFPSSSEAFLLTRL